MFLELNAPLKPEIMALITDAEYENTERLLIRTPTGKKVKYVKASMLDKIRTEIKGWQDDIHDNEYDADKYDFVFERIFEIIDKYKSKGEGMT